MVIVVLSEKMSVDCPCNKFFVLRSKKAAIIILIFISAIYDIPRASPNLHPLATLKLRFVHRKARRIENTRYLAGI